MKIKDLLGTIKEELSDLSTLDSPDFRLEQAEKNKDDGYWNVVVSYLVENTNKKIPNFGALTSGGFEYVRLYKEVKLNEDGEVLGVFMYKD